MEEGLLGAAMTLELGEGCSESYSHSRETHRSPWHANML